ncbi:MAG: hypothetical protein QM490_01890 [Candidatus Gracilibacteria bacterium]
MKYTKKDIFNRLDNIYKHIDFIEMKYKTEVQNIYTVLKTLNFEDIKEVHQMLEMIDDLEIQVIELK